MAYGIMGDCIGCAVCARVCPVGAIGGERGSLHGIDPGRCIECGACGRVCPSAAVRDDRGVVVEKLVRSDWKRPVFDLSRCISCGACESKCPVDCISLSEGEPGGFGAWPRLSEPLKCVSCGYCAFYCPMSCIAIATPVAVAAKEALR